MEDGFNLGFNWDKDLKERMNILESNILIWFYKIHWHKTTDGKINLSKKVLIDNF